MFYCTSWVHSLNVAWIVVIFRFPTVINFLQTNIFVLICKKQLRRFQPAKMFTKIQRHLDFFLLPKNGLAPFCTRSTLEKEPLTGNFHQLETLKTQVSCCLTKMVRDVFVVGLCRRLTWGPFGSCWFKMVPPWSLRYPLKKLMVVKRSFLLGFVNFSLRNMLNFRGVLPLSATATQPTRMLFSSWSLSTGNVWDQTTSSKMDFLFQASMFFHLIMFRLGPRDVWIGRWWFHPLFRLFFPL